MLPKEYFTDKEVQCRCGCGLKPPQTSIERLYALRIMLGFPLPINSGARCIEHNNKIGGAKHSAHLCDNEGCGYDIAVGRDQIDKRQKLIEAATSLGFKGFGYGKTFIHIDDANRSKITEWWY